MNYLICGSTDKIIAHFFSFTFFLPKYLYHQQVTCCVVYQIIINVLNSLISRTPCKPINIISSYITKIIRLKSFFILHLIPKSTKFLPAPHLPWLYSKLTFAKHLSSSSRFSFSNSSSGYWSLGHGAMGQSSVGMSIRWFTLECEHVRRAVNERNYVTVLIYAIISLVNHAYFPGV